jgi:glycosyltransferase involved in cell wall biosynthesis
LMKKLNVNNTIDKKTGGGTAERTLKMSESLQEAGLECSILSDDMSDENGPTIRGEENTILLPCISKRLYLPSLSLTTFRMIREAVLAADIVHLMSHWTFINAFVYLLIRIYRKKYVVCPAGSMTIYGRSKTFKRIYNYIIGKSIIKNASSCIAITKDEIKQFESYGIRKENIALIPNGVSSSDFETSNHEDFKKQFGLSDKPMILFWTAEFH